MNKFLVGAFCLFACNRATPEGPLAKEGEVFAKTEWIPAPMRQKEWTVAKWVSAGTAKKMDAAGAACDAEAGVLRSKAELWLVTVIRCGGTYLTNSTGLRTEGMPIATSSPSDVEKLTLEAKFAEPFVGPESILWVTTSIAAGKGRTLRTDLGMKRIGGQMVRVLEQLSNDPKEVIFEGSAPKSFVVRGVDTEIRLRWSDTQRSYIYERSVPLAPPPNSAAAPPPSSSSTAPQRKP